MAEKDASSSLEPRLRSALESAGLRYHVRVTPKGVPYAGFRYLPDHGPEIGLTAIIEDGGLRLTAHALIAGPATERALWHANEINRDWQEGCFFYNQDNEMYEAALGVYAGTDGPISPEALLDAVRYLADACRYLLHYAVPPPAIAGGKTALDAVARQLAATGFAPVAAPDGKRLLLKLGTDSGHQYLIEFYATQGNALLLRGRNWGDPPVREDAGVLHAATRINAALRAGSVFLTQDPPSACYRLALASCAGEIDGGALRWGIDLATAALDMMERHLY